MLQMMNISIKAKLRTQVNLEATRRELKKRDADRDTVKVREKESEISHTQEQTMNCTLSKYLCSPFTYWWRGSWSLCLQCSCSLYLHRSSKFILTLLSLVNQVKLFSICSAAFRREQAFRLLQLLPSTYTLHTTKTDIRDNNNVHVPTGSTSRRWPHKRVSG